MGLLAAAVGYLLGSFPTGYLVGLAKGVDVRRYGSGATGGTNVQRTLGWGPAVVTGIGDIGKGILASYIGYRLGGNAGYALGGFGAIVGHSWPVWLKFRGGKSVGTGAGTLMLQHPLALLAALVFGFGVIVPTRYVGLGSLVGAIVLGGSIWLSGAPLEHKLLALGAVLVVYVRHWDNILRMLAGTENKFGQTAKPRNENPA
ncbi:MAG TPA: glycerol-3-phosphate 1-O-acyltransferase PlsY [Symbiobacteriaceae bacterium]|jgi:glycerol-3-phosphate acyltransferase PlsY